MNERTALDDSPGGNRVPLYMMDQPSLCLFLNTKSHNPKSSYMFAYKKLLLIKLCMVMGILDWHGSQNMNVRAKRQNCNAMLILILHDFVCTKICLILNKKILEAVGYSFGSPHCSFVATIIHG
jgi:hypothetical protein